MDDSKINEAAELVRKDEKRYRAFFAVGAVLKEVSDLANLRREAEQATAIAGVATEKAKAELATVEIALVEAQQDFEVARNEKQVIVEGAKAARDGILAAGREGAKQLRQKVERELTIARERIESDAAAHTMRMATWASDEKKLRDRVEEIKQELTALKKRIG